MNFDKFYENIVLRDLIEYLIPGTILVLSLSLIIYSFPGNNVIALYIAQSSKENSLHGFLVILFSYTSGHCLTAISQQLFRHKESRELTFDNLFEDEWTRMTITQAVAKLYNIDDKEASEILQNKVRFDFFRETLRSYTQIRMPLAFREFIIRLSILSRFCQNMSLAISLLFLSLVYAIGMSNYIIGGITGAKKIIAIAVGIALLSLLGYSILVFWRRAKSLREQMIKNTFQIWLTDYMNLIPKNNSAS